MKSNKTGDLMVERNSLLLLASDVAWHKGGVLAWATARGHVWILGPVESVVCYHQRSGEHSWSGLLPGDMLMSEGYGETGPTSYLRIMKELALGTGEQKANYTLDQLQYSGEWAMNFIWEA